MLTLWYLILGWKEYNKPFRKTEHPAKPVDPIKKPDLIPQKKDGKPTEPTKPADIKKPEPPKSIAIDPRPPTIPPRAPDSFFFNNKTPDTPKIPDLPKPNVSSPTTPKIPELPKMSPKTPDVPKMPEPAKTLPKTPETPKVPESPKTLPKTPETPKLPEPPKTVPKTPEVPKMPDFQRFAPDVPKTPESPKAPELSKLSPKSPDPPKVPEPPNMMPSRRPESVLPNFPPSSRNPAYVPQTNPAEFDLPPYLPGTPGNQRPTAKGDELFNVGNNFNNPTPSKPLANLRDLSYAKGESSEDDDDFSQGNEAFREKIQESLSRIPKYMEQSVISNPDSLESDEDDV